MTLNEAIMDPKRPLSIAPSEWMMATEAKLAEEQELTDKSAERVIIARKKQPDESASKAADVSSIEKLDAGIDELVQGCKILMSALDELKRVDLQPSERKVIDKIDDLANNAIGPYLVEIIEASQSLESNE